jgi:hypothetical protein
MSEISYAKINIQHVKDNSANVFQIITFSIPKGNADEETTARLLSELYLKTIKKPMAIVTPLIKEVPQS